LGDPEEGHHCKLGFIERPRELTRCRRVNGKNQGRADPLYTGLDPDKIIPNMIDKQGRAGGWPLNAAGRVKESQTKRRSEEENNKASPFSVLREGAQNTRGAGGENRVIHNPWGRGQGNPFAEQGKGQGEKIAPHQRENSD